MLEHKEDLVMDVFPWPDGRGFTGGDAWWDYIMNKEELRRLDSLMGLALLDTEIRDQLIDQRDHTLFEAFGLSSETQTWLSSLDASTLVELAKAIVSTR